MDYDKLHDAIEALDLDEDQFRTASELLQKDTITQEDLINFLDTLSVDDEDARQVYVFGEDELNMSVANWDWVSEIVNSRNTPTKADSQFEEVQKSSPGSTRDPEDVGEQFVLKTGVSNYDIVTPPFCPEGLRQLLELDPIHHRACKAKVRDSVIRGFDIVPAVPVKKLDERSGTEKDDVGVPEPPNAVSQDIINQETLEADQFFRTVNRISGIEGILEKAAMDFEAIGWCAIEVIRDMEGRVRYLEHIPAERVRVLKDHKGFVEISQKRGIPNPTYYQVFGDKWRSKERVDPLTDEPLPWDPELDGGDITQTGQPAFIDRDTGEPTNDVRQAANEILFRAQHHPRSIYYGVPDIVPALGHLLANVEIRDYLLQFFSNNTVPRYAIILKGARLSDEDINVIKKYFDQQVKGSAHRTLFIPLRSTRGNVELSFERLDADEKEGSFQETLMKNDEHIMVAHGTPPAILGVFEAASLGSGKGMSQAEIYKDRIVDPLQRGWADLLRKLLYYGIGLTTVKPLFDPLDTRDRLSEMQILTGYQQMGDLSVNEVRAKNGDPPIKGGDRHYIAFRTGVEFVDTLQDAKSSSEERLAIAEASESKEKEMDEEADPIAMDGVKEQSPSGGPNE